MARVLMIAYSADPEASSEGGVGWRIASGVAAHHDVHLLTRPKARPALERELRRRSDLRLTIEYHEMWGLRQLKHRFGLPVSNLRYLAWNHRLQHRVSQLEATGDFDLVHHTTWVRYWMPSAGGRTRLPFVWGPVGAAERTPWALLPTLRPRSWPGELGKMLGPLALRADPLLRDAQRNADAIVASSFDTARVFERQGAPVQVAPSVGYDPAELPAASATKESDFISVGRLLGWKGFHLGLEAFARWAPPQTRYEVVGDGPEMSRLVGLVRNLGVSDRVTFHGALTRPETLERISRSRMLVHPSFHDSGGFVVVEAQALGVPVLCLDVGGPALLIGSVGHAVRPGSRRQVVRRLGEVMQAPSFPDGAAISAHAAASLTWNRIVGEYLQVYEDVASPGPVSGDAPPDETRRDRMPPRPSRPQPPDPAGKATDGSRRPR